MNSGYIRYFAVTALAVSFIGVLAVGGVGETVAQDVAADPASSGSTHVEKGLVEKGPVEKGKYLARAGNCHSCHTRPGGEPFAGGLSFTTDFGVIYSSNITPDPETGIGGWSEEEFVRAMHEGVSADGHNLYPVFPYPSYTKVSEEDVKAIYAYIKTLTPVSYTPPENELDFPYNQRWLMAIWNLLYFDEGRYREDPALSAEANRGAYLTQGLGHCGSCHTPRDSLGGLESELALAGGTYLDSVEEGKVRPWSAVNLTAGPGGLEKWSADDIAAYLKKGYNKHAATFGPMNEVILNSTRYLTDADVRAIGTYLKTLPALGDNGAVEIDEEIMREGSIIYDTRCGTCHLPTGLGSEDTGTPLVGSTVVLAADPASLINSILYGASAPRELPVPEEWANMKAFGNLLDDEEVALLATFIRNSWGNKASPVTEEQVLRQR